MCLLSCRLLRKRALVLFVIAALRNLRLASACALDLSSVKMPQFHAVARVYESSAEQPMTFANCSCDTAVSCASTRFELYSALDFISACPVSCAHPNVFECSAVTIAQVDTRGSSPDAHDYNNNLTPRNRQFVLMLPSLFVYRFCITLLISRGHSSLMSLLLARSDAAEIFATA